MLLRRITQHVKDQNWFAVGIDFIIVALGVFMGLQVSNWNDARAEQTLRSEYLAQLTEDLQADIAEAADTERYAWTRAAAIEDVFDAAGLEKPLREFYIDGTVAKAPPLPEFTTDYPFAHNHIITNVPTFEETRETFDTIVSNGHFGLLGDSNLVRQIQQYQRQVESIKGFDIAIVETFRRLTELRSRHGIALGGRTTLQGLAKAVKEDPQLAAELDTYFLHSASQAGLSIELQTAAKTLIEAIEKAQ